MAVWTAAFFVAAQPATTPPLNADVAAAVTACVRPQDRQRPVSALTLAQRQRVVGCINRRMAAQINPQLPVRIDASTELERLTTAGPILLYHYRIAGRAADLPRDAAARLDASTRANVCAQASMRQTMAMGGAYGYRWRDSAGILVHQMRVERC